ncbi:MAG: type II toxin-antitoxin system RelE/ParE family toxin [Opitutaceae bacterium]|nr:type II toxin-antitoxin system RelE/ParE family toxin [Opitutaceae bacterium]
MAARELVTISLWIAQDNPPAAARWLETTESRVAALATFPERCPPAPEARETGVQVRQLLVGKKRGLYRVLFCVKEREVQILRIIHGMRRHLTPKEIEEAGWDP